jgi:hypothetical protein
MLSAAGRALTRSFRSKPIFVVGAGRSGTTVVQSALGTHPAIIASPAEAPFICSIGSAAASLASGTTANYRRRTLRTSLSYTHDALRRIAFESAMGAHFGLRRVVGQAVKARKAPFAIQRWCTKTFPGLLVADGLSLLYPDARFVYVFRAGTEVVESRTLFPAMSDRSFEDHCREWASSVERYAYLLADERAITIRHEELTASPDTVFASVLSFLDVAQHQAPGTFARTTLIHPLDEPTRVGVSASERLVTRAPAHDTWTDEERKTFTALCGDAMRRLGYELPF